MEKHAEIINTMKLEELHRNSQKWISNLHFIGDEISFIDKLLNSYVFEPTTPNLFERLQVFLKKLEIAKTRLNELYDAVCVHERELGGLMECTSLPENLEIESGHTALGEGILEYQGKFNMLKSEIFNYAGGILRKRKK